MKSFAVLCMLGIFAGLVHGQCQLNPSTNDINLNSWTSIGDASGNWVVQTGGNTVVQTFNTNVNTRYVSDFVVGSSDIIRGTLMGRQGDDDYIGFSMGLQCSGAPLTCNTASEAVNISWCNGGTTGTAPQGLCASRTLFTNTIQSCPRVQVADVTANPNFCDDLNASFGLTGALVNRPYFANPANFHPTLTCQEKPTGTCTVAVCCDRVCPVGRKVGWEYDRVYDFIIQYTPDRLRVYVDLVEVFDYRPADHSEPLMEVDAHASFSCQSQGQVTFGNFQLLDTGTTDCSFDPWEYSMPVADAGCGGIATLFVDYGDGFTDIINLDDDDFDLSHVYGPSPEGFRRVTTQLRVDGIPTGNPEQVLAFVLEPVTPVLTAVDNGFCAFDKSCANDGEVRLGSITGGNRPYSIAWNNGVVQTEAVECSGDCTSSISGLPDGMYSIVVTDSNGCTGSASITIGTSRVTVSSLRSETCGALTLEASSTCNPVSYMWSTSDGSGLSPTAQNQSGLGPGTYSVVVTDRNDCTDTASIDINYGFTGPAVDGTFFMYIPVRVTWAGFPEGSPGSIIFQCPGETALPVFTGDLGLVTEVDFSPYAVTPGGDCEFRVTGALNPGCFTTWGPFYVCANTNVGARRCNDNYY